MATPKVLRDQLDRLDEIAEQYPHVIPVKVIADFLGVSTETVRNTVMYSTNPIGAGYKVPGTTRREMVIPTLKFYLWMKNNKLS